MTRQAVVSTAMEEAVQQRHPDSPKSRRAGLGALAGVMREVRRAKRMALATGRPRAIGTAHDRSPYIERQLQHARTEVDGTRQP